MIAIVDYGLGNVQSIANMLKKAGASSALITSDADDLQRASKMILPGVGAFDEGVRRLEASGLLPAVENAALARKVPTLGICLGMQLLGSTSEEGVRSGLGWLPVRTVRFRMEGSQATLPIPNMGWRAVVTHRVNPLLPSEFDELRFYFLHSFHVMTDEESVVLATANYGYEFPCAIGKGNIFGVQFHPEKSHRFGLALLRSFAEMEPAWNPE